MTSYGTTRGDGTCRTASENKCHCARCPYGAPSGAGVTAAPPSSAGARESAPDSRGATDASMRGAFCASVEQESASSAFSKRTRGLISTANAEAVDGNGKTTRYLAGACWGTLGVEQPLHDEVGKIGDLCVRKSRRAVVLDAEGDFATNRLSEVADCSGVKVRARIVRVAKRRHLESSAVG